MDRAASEQEDLIERFKRGNAAAFEALYTPLEQAIRDDIRECIREDSAIPDMREDEAMHDIAEMTRRYLLVQGRANYDSTRNSFLDYAKSCARDAAAFKAFYMPIEKTINDNIQKRIDEDRAIKDTAEDEIIRDIAEMTRHYLFVQGRANDYVKGDASDDSSHSSFLAYAKSCACDMILVKQFQSGDANAFESLYMPVDKAILGRIRGKTFYDDEAVQEIAQMTRLYILDQDCKNYDPVRNTFLAYAKSRADSRIKEYNKQRQELVLLDPKGSYTGSDDEIENLLERVSGEAAPSAEEESLEAGADRLRLEAFDMFFEITFNHGTSPPHYLIAFGFKHLWRDPGAKYDPRAKKPLPLLWPPRRIAMELSDEALSVLQNRLEVGLFDAFQLPPSRLDGHLREQRRWMGQTVAAVAEQSLSRPLLDIVEQIRTNPNWSRQKWAWVAAFTRHVMQHEALQPTQAALTEALTTWQMGETSFRQYYTRLPEDNISSWSDSIWRRVSGAILKQGWGELFERLLQAKRYESQLEQAEAPSETGDVPGLHMED